MCVGGVLCIASYVLFLYGKRRILAERAAGSPCTRTRARWQRWMPFLFSMYAALLGTQSVIYGKTLAVLLRTTLAGDSQIGNWCGGRRVGRMLMLPAVGAAACSCPLVCGTMQTLHHPWPCQPSKVHLAVSPHLCHLRRLVGHAIQPGTTSSAL